MLKRIRCDKFREKEIIFHPGLNAVMGDEIASNSIGKSTLLMIIDFVFGGSEYIKTNSDAIEQLGPHEFLFATVYKGNIIKNLIMDCQSYTKYRPNETTGGIFVSWRRKEELPTGA